MSFCTVINCMDGRIQLPVNEFLRNRFKVDYVDTITEPGPNQILAEEKDIAAIVDRLKISLEKHNSVGIAIVGHHDCAGNPVAKEQQLEHLKQSLARLQQEYQDVPIIGLWVDENWTVEEVS